jgi:hypothetical protein
MASELREEMLREQNQLIFDRFFQSLRQAEVRINRQWRKQVGNSYPER